MSKLPSDSGIPATFSIYVNLRCAAISVYPIEEWKKQRTIAVIAGSMAVFHEPVLEAIGAKSDGPGISSDDGSRGFLDYNVQSESGDFEVVRTALTAAGFELDGTTPPYLPHEVIE